MWPPATLSSCNAAHGAAVGQNGRALALLEGQLTWLVHIVGAIIKGRLSSSSAESQARRCVRPICDDQNSRFPCCALIDQHHEERICLGCVTLLLECGANRWSSARHNHRDLFCMIVSARTGRGFIALKSSARWSVNGSKRLTTQETIDGDLAARVFGLLQVVDTGAHAQRYGEHSRQRLDIAILGFFQGFRKVYIGEQVMHASKVRFGGRWGAAI